MQRTARRCVPALAIFVAATAVLVGPAPLLAQNTGGDLLGRVQSTDGSPMPGVLVTVTGPSLIGSRELVTGPTGSFRFTSLAGGSYTVQLGLTGYRTVAFHDVRVVLGRATALGAGVTTLEASPVELEPLIVLAGNSTIDVSTASLGMSLTAETFTDLPTERDYRDLIKLAPHANPSFIGDPINIAGATGLENLTYIDGLNVTDPFVGGQGTRLPYNFVRELQVRTGGYEAEYGGAGGGIFNVVTESGGNEWSFSAFGYLNNAALTADAQLGVGDLTSSGADAYDVGVSVGGPIARDRLWFFAAYDPSFATADVEIPGNGVFEDKKTEHLFASKLSWHAGPSTDLVAAFFGDPTTHDRVGAGPFSRNVTQILDPEVFLNRVERGGYNATLDLTRRFESSAVVDLSLGGQWTGNYDGPEPDDAAARYTCLGESGCDGLIPGATSGGFGELFAFDGRRLSARLSGTFFLGSHTPKLGLEYEVSSLSPFEARNSGVGVILDRGPGAGTSRWRVIVQERAATLKSRVPTLYAQDSWAISDRLRLNYGVRWEGHDIIDSRGSVAQSISDQWQPRLGLIWEPSAGGDQKITGSAGRFYQRMPLRLLTDYYSALDHSINYLINYDGDPRTGGQPVPATQVTFCCSVQPVRDLKGTHFDEVTVGYERLVGQHLRIGARGVYRTLRDVINTGSPEDPSPGSSPVQVGNPGRADLAVLEKPERIYRALELTADWLGHPRLRASASYVLSRTEGNFPGMFQSDGDGFLFPNNYGLFRYPYQMANNDGPLPNDRPHVLKLWGSYRFDSALSAGAFLSVQSGIPESRYMGLFGNQAVFLSPRGSEGRTPALWDLNFRLEYPIQLSSNPGWSARLIADFLHIGNPQEVARYDQLESIGPVPNPVYREPVAFQEPFTVRLGLAVGF